MDEPAYVARPVTSQEFIRASIDKVWALISNLTDYPRFMRDVNDVTVRVDDGVQISDWDTDVEGTPFYWTERDTFYPDRYRIEFTLHDKPAIANDLDRFQGYWQLTTVEGGTQAELYTDWDFDVPSLMKMMGPTLEEKIKENGDMMLECVRIECEQPQTT